MPYANNGLPMGRTFEREKIRIRTFLFCLTEKSVGVERRMEGNCLLLPKKVCMTGPYVDQFRPPLFSVRQRREILTRNFCSLNIPPIGSGSASSVLLLCLWKPVSWNALSGPVGSRKTSKDLTKNIPVF